MEAGGGTCDGLQEWLDTEEEEEEEACGCNTLRTDGKAPRHDLTMGNQHSVLYTRYKYYKFNEVHP
jgi:hypothetical protein